MNTIFQGGGLKAFFLTLLTGAAVSLTACKKGPVDVDVAELGGGCYAVQSPGTGLYLASRELPLQERYSFTEEKPEKAGHFFFSAVEPGVFLLRDRDGAFVGSNVPFLEIALQENSAKAQWELDRNDNGYVLRNRHTHALLRHTYREGEELREKTIVYESSFALIPQDDCTE